MNMGHKNRYWLAIEFVLWHFSERGKLLENFTYEDKEMADIFEETFYNTSFLGVTVYIMFTNYYKLVSLAPA